MDICYRKEKYNKYFVYTVTISQILIEIHEIPVY